MKTPVDNKYWNQFLPCPLWVPRPCPLCPLCPENYIALTSTTLLQHHYPHPFNHHHHHHNHNVNTSPFLLFLFPLPSFLSRFVTTFPSTLLPLLIILFIILIIILIIISILMMITLVKSEERKSLWPLFAPFSLSFSWAVDLPGWILGEPSWVVDLLEGAGDATFSPCLVWKFNHLLYISFSWSFSVSLFEGRQVSL